MPDLLDYLPAQWRHDSATPPEDSDTRLDDDEVIALVARELKVPAARVCVDEVAWDAEGDGFVWSGCVWCDEQGAVGGWSCDDETGDVLVVWGAA